MRQDGWITHIQRYCYSTAGLPWGPEKKRGRGKGGGRHIVKNSALSLFEVDLSMNISI